MHDEYARIEAALETQKADYQVYSARFATRTQTIGALQQTHEELISMLRESYQKKTEVGDALDEFLKSQ